MTDRAQRPPRRTYRIALALTLIAGVLYACLFLLAGVLVAYLAGEVATAAATAALAVGVPVGTLVATWLTQPYLHRIVGQILSGDRGPGSGR